MINFDNSLVEMVDLFFLIIGFRNGFFWGMFVYILCFYGRKGRRV